MKVVSEDGLTKLIQLTKDNFISNNDTVQASAVSIDDSSITISAQSKLQAAGVIEKNAGATKYDWVGTKQQYANLGTYNTNWIYYITDDDSATDSIDGSTITRNISGQLQTVGIKDAHTSETMKVWTGTKLQYDNLSSYDNNTIYNITDDNTTNITEILDIIYPVGSLYFGMMATCPLSGIIGTWQRISAGKVIQVADEENTAGTII